MAAIHGADVEELERLAFEFSRAADELDADGSQLTHLLGNVSWLGEVASRYVGTWTGVQLPRLGLSTRFLREAADELRRHAQQQRAASEAGAGTAAARGSGSSSMMTTPRAQLEAEFADNETRMRSYLDSLVPHDPFRRAVEERIEQGYRVYHFDPDRQYLAWTTANITTASRVVLTVPGTGANWTNVSQGFTSEGGAYLIGRDGDTAVISTMVWDPPATLLSFDVRAGAARLSDDVPSIADGPMPDMLRSLHESGRSVVVVGHSAGAAAVQHLFTSDPSLVQHVDGVALLAPGDFDPALPAVMGDRRVLVGLHDDDPIHASYGEEMGEIISIGLADNVSLRTQGSESNVLPGLMGTIEDAFNGDGVGAHAHERYAQNFREDVHALFRGPHRSPDGMVGQKVVDSDGTISTVWTGTF